MQQKPRYRMVVIYLWQLSVGILLSCFAFIFGEDFGLSFFYGVMLFALAHGFAVWRLYSNKREYRPAVIVMKLLGGELFKLIILAAGVVFIAKYVNLTWFSFLGGLALMQIASWLLPLWFNHKGVLAL